MYLVSAENSSGRSQVNHTAVAETSTALKLMTFLAGTGSGTSSVTDTKRVGLLIPVPAEVVAEILKAYLYKREFICY